MRIRAWLASLTDRRRSPRFLTETVAVYYWTGGVPKPMDVHDISMHGAYIVGPNMFYPATLVQIVFENKAKAASTICVCAQVRRKTQDGFCVSFLFSDSRERRLLRQFLAGVKRKDPSESKPAEVETADPDGVKLIASGDIQKGHDEAQRMTAENQRGGAQRQSEERLELTADSEAPEAEEVAESRKLRRKRRAAARRLTSSGQALIEFALILPLLFLLIVNVVNFGSMFYAWISVSNAARAGAQYYITGPATLGAPSRPTGAAVQALVMNDLYSLPNSLTAQVCVSTSISATVSCNTGTAPSSAPPAAETAEGTPPVTFAVGAVDVTYVYQPFIPLWNFPRLGIRATLPPTTIHRQAVMRILQ